MAFLTRCCGCPLILAITIFAGLGVLFDLINLFCYSPMLTAAGNASEPLSNILTTFVKMTTGLSTVDLVLKVGLVLSACCEQPCLSMVYVVGESLLLTAKMCGYFWFVSASMSANFPPECAAVVVALLLVWALDAYLVHVALSYSSE